MADPMAVDDGAALPGSVGAHAPDDPRDDAGGGACAKDDGAACGSLLGSARAKDDGPACGSLLNAISTARFQQRLIALVGEKEGFEQRVLCLEHKLKRADAALKSALDDKAELQAAARATERRVQEADALSDRHRASLDAETTRHELLTRLADEQTAEATRKIGEQAEQIHTLGEQLQAATSAAAGLRAFQKSSEQLIESFHAKVGEVSSLLENVRQAERVCRSTMVRVSEEQRGLRSQLCRLQSEQASVEGRSKLITLLKGAREAAKEKEALAMQRLGELDSTRQELQLMHDGHADALATTRQMRSDAAAQQALMRNMDTTLDDQARQMEGVLRRNMLLSETNEHVRGELRRKEATVQLLTREICHADALAHSADRLAVVRAQVESAELAAARTRTAALQEELKASGDARKRGMAAQAAVHARLAEVEEEMEQSRAQLAAAKAGAVAAHPTDEEEGGAEDAASAPQPQAPRHAGHAQAPPIDASRSRGEVNPLVPAEVRVEPPVASRNPDVVEAELRMVPPVASRDPVMHPVASRDPGDECPLTGLSVPVHDARAGSRETAALPQEPARPPKRPISPEPQATEASATSEPARPATDKPVDPQPARTHGAAATAKPAPKRLRNTLAMVKKNSLA